MKEKQNGIIGKTKSEKPLLADMHLDGVRFDKRILSVKKQERESDVDVKATKSKYGEA